MRERERGKRERGKREREREKREREEGGKRTLKEDRRVAKRGGGM